MREASAVSAAAPVAPEDAAIGHTYMPRCAALSLTNLLCNKLCLTLRPAAAVDACCPCAWIGGREFGQWHLEQAALCRFWCLLNIGGLEAAYGQLKLVIPHGACCPFSPTGRCPVCTAVAATCRLSCWAPPEAPAPPWHASWLVCFPSAAAVAVSPVTSSARHEGSFSTWRMAGGRSARRG